MNCARLGGRWDVRRRPIRKLGLCMVGGWLARRAGGGVGIGGSFLQEYLFLSVDHSGRGEVRRDGNGGI